jgi:hypothetical protein
MLCSSFKKGKLLVKMFLEIGHADTISGVSALIVNLLQLVRKHVLPAPV